MLIVVAAAMAPAVVPVSRPAAAAERRPGGQVISAVRANRFAPLGRDQPTSLGLGDDYPQLPLCTPDYPLFPQFFVIVCNALQQASICVNYW